MNIRFTIPEENIVAIYAEGSRERTIDNINFAMPYMDEDMRQLAAAAVDMLFTYPVAGTPDKVIALLVGMVLFVVNKANRIENQVIMQMFFINVSCQNKLILAA